MLVDELLTNLSKPCGVEMEHVPGSLLDDQLRVGRQDPDLDLLRPQSALWKSVPGLDSQLDQTYPFSYSQKP
jgi:hypothetical protein